MVRKKVDTVLISIHFSCTAKIFKAMLSCFRDLELTKCNSLQPFEERRQKLHEPGCFNFSSDLMFYYLIFHLPNFLIVLINWMIGSSHSQLCKKNRCSVKMQGGPLDYNPRKKPMENSWIIIILQNNSKCLLLNDKQMPHKILFSLLQ